MMAQFSVTLCPGDCVLFCSLRILDTHGVHIHTWKTNMHTHKIKISNSFKNEKPLYRYIFWLICAWYFESCVWFFDYAIVLTRMFRHDVFILSNTLICLYMSPWCEEKLLFISLSELPFLLPVLLWPCVSCTGCLLCSGNLLQTVFTSFLNH